MREGVVRRAALSVGCAALLAGCGSATAGEPVASEHARPSTVEPSTSAAAEYSLAHLCDLLSPEESSSMGGGRAGKKGNPLNDGHEICAWADEMNLLIGVQPDMRTHGGNKGPNITNKPVTVGGMAAVLSHQTKPFVLCQVLVNLPSGNLYSAGAGPLSRGEGKYDPCELAMRMGELTVPRIKDQ